jgi:precorrin-8X/cobalt-precorrin-8 methylmutase
MSYIRDPAEITRRSFEIIAAEADLGALPAAMRTVAARLVHASGMTDIVADLAFSAGAVEIGQTALRAGAAIVTDVAMVAAGIAARRLPAANEVLVAVRAEDAAAHASEAQTTRSAGGMEALAGKLDGAVVAIGNAPTALFRLLELCESNRAFPSLVLGFPVGFVGAAESKEALIANTLGISFIALRGRRGGSAMAAAAVNALFLGEDAA